MELRNLGESGLRVSLVGLGCNNFGNRIGYEEAHRVIHRALDLGINFFDTADVYGNRGGSEEMIGRALGERRKDMILATKFGLPMDDAGTMKGGSRRYIRSAVEASLQRLRTDWIDLYMLHVPDPETPIEETLRALDELIREGKIRYGGCSGFAAWQMVEASYIARELGINRLICGMQEFSLLARAPEKELLPALKSQGIGLLPFFPLAGGMLSGKYRGDAELPKGTRLTDSGNKRFLNEPNLKKADELRRFAEARGHTLLELAFSWLAMHDVVGSIIAGATSTTQVEANVKAVGWTLGPDDLKEIDRITLG